MSPRHANFILISAAVCLLCYATHRRIRSVMLIGDAVNLIDAYYVEEVDRDELLSSAMKGLTQGLDEHSEFIPVEDYSTFQDSIQQEFAGIGILVDQPEKGKPVRVITPLVGSPALESGMRPKDKIIRVDDEDVSSMLIADVSKRLRGPIGTDVRLGIQREREEVELIVRRDRIQLQSVLGDFRDENDQWVYRLKKDPRTAYMRMTSFGEKTRGELERVLIDLNNDFDALILDLRGNGGGLLHTAVHVADMFLESGNVVSTRIRGGEIESTFDATSGTLVATDKPVAILIDGNSASASEIVAAALQDNQRAIIVGTRSYGKGTVQNILPLQYGRSALRLTVARYYRPSGVNIHRGKDASDDDPWGVTPNEGAIVDLQPADVQNIIKRWERAAYPSLANSRDADLEAKASLDPLPEDVTDDPSLDTPEESSVSPTPTNTAVDPQLERAIELLKTQQANGLLPIAA